jgi:hypothetical protein
VSDHWLDALEYAMRPKEPRHLRGWRKARSWLRSRPLARVRRNLATEKRIRAIFAREPLSSAEVMAVARKLRKNTVGHHEG